jgi:hypothetical protein
MEILYALLLTTSLVCFLIRTVGPVDSIGKRFAVNFIALGLALWVLVLVIQTWQQV